MSKAVKTIIGVVASIAIPFAAPALASSMGMSAAIGSAVGSATAGSVIGGAITGAALGAAKGAILGEDVGRSALMGGLGGGVGGYSYTPTGGAVATPVAQSNVVGVDLAPLAQTTVNEFGQIVAIPPTAAPAGLAGVPQTTVNEFGQIVSAGPDATGLASSLTPTAAAAPAPAAGLQSYGNMGNLDAVIGTGGAVAPAAAAAPTTFSAALSQAGDALKAKLLDPKNMADFTLRAAGQLAGSALAGSGLSAEEQALLDQQTAELRNLQQTNQGLFNERLEQARNLIGESRYFDPEYFGLQSARRQQVAGAQQRRAGLRGLTGEARESAGRKYDLGTSRNVGTAYDSGFQSAVSPRLQTIQAGLSAMPTSGPSNAAGYGALQQAYGEARTNRRQTQADIGTLFGSLTGRS